MSDTQSSLCHALMFRLGVTTLLWFAMVASAVANPVHVVMETDLGDIYLELYPDRAPKTVANFLRYVEGGHYDGGSFYRTVTKANDKGTPVIEVIQGGLGGMEAPLPPVAHEGTQETGILHTDGVISMARAAPGTAQAEFFICVGDQPGLDQGATRNADGLGFAAFGRVIKGMDVVRSIHEQPSNTPIEAPYLQGQILTDAVLIVTVSRVPAQSGEQRLD